MPGYDRRGPNGEGPKTGRGLGRCGTNREVVETEIHDSRPRRLRDGSGRGSHRGGSGLRRHRHD